MEIYLKKILDYNRVYFSRVSKGDVQGASILLQAIQALRIKSISQTH